MPQPNPERRDSSLFAKKALRALVAYVFRSLDSGGALVGINYTELAERIGYLNRHGKAHAHGMHHVLNRMTDLMREAVCLPQGESVPIIQSIVISKAQGLASNGVDHAWPGYSSLSALEKKDKCDEEYKRVQEFGDRWNEVLSCLGWPPVERSAVRGEKSQ